VLAEENGRRLKAPLTGGSHLSAGRKNKRKEKGKGVRREGLLGSCWAAAPGWPKGCPAFIFIFLLLFFSFFYFVISLKIETKLFGFGYFKVCKLLNNVPRCLATQIICLV
jgi:hypothetical protein